MNEYRVDIKLRNNLILKKIEDFGYNSVSQFSELNDISLNLLYQIIGMKYPIFNKLCEINPFIHKLCEILNCELNDLFTQDQMNLQLKKNKSSFCISENEVQYFMNMNKEVKSLEQSYSEGQLKEKLDEVLSSLTPLEANVLRMRFGIDMDTDHTLEEVGKKFDVTHERIRQIEAKALRKLRHPKRSDILRYFVEE